MVVGGLVLVVREADLDGHLLFHLLAPGLQHPAKPTGVHLARVLKIVTL